MWFLDAKTVELRNVPFERAKEEGYTILSHTWGDHEISFQDMKTGGIIERKIELQDGEGIANDGYSKIRATCRKTIEDGYSYAWVDTCCINKESSAELSEAINSMWKWYSYANICYVYLADLEAHHPPLFDLNNASLPGHELPSDEESRTEIREAHRAFASARWFTRSWTLQELIAPSDVRFYNSAWIYVGAKSCLLKSLTRITRIDAKALEGRSSGRDFVAARKISWASGRQASREEDRAYSLLGLLGLNMPLIYGEGDRAFLRLQQEIIRNSTDHSIFAFDETPEMFRSHGPKPSLFARSPDQFASGRRIVPCLFKKMDAPFRLTNRGLEFDAMRMAEWKGSWRILLNCRYEDDPRGPLSLCLKAGSAPTEAQSDNGQVALPNDFWLDWHEDATKMTSEASSLFPRRVDVLDVLAVGSEPRPVTMTSREHMGVLRSFSTTGDTNYNIIWLRETAMDGTLLAPNIIEAKPDRVWNTATGVLNFAGEEQLEHRCIGSATLSLGQLVHIAFVVMENDFETGENLRSPDLMRRPCRLAMSKRSQNAARRIVSGDTASEKAYVNFPEDEIRISAHMSWQKVMNEWIRVLQVDVTHLNRNLERHKPRRIPNWLW